MLVSARGIKGEMPKGFIGKSEKGKRDEQNEQIPMLFSVFWQEISE